MQTLRRWLLILALCALPVLVAGCATMSGLAPGHGTVAVVDGPSYDEVWRATVAVVSQSLVIVTSDKDGGVLKAERPAGLNSTGELVGVFITAVDDSVTRHRVEVVSRKRSRVQLTGQDWEPHILEGVKLRLGL